MEVKFEIKLIAKEAINGYKVGETVIFINPIFDKNIGLAFFPIDINFDIFYKRQYIGLQASDEDVFDGDILSDGEDEYQVWIDEGKILIGGRNKEWDEFISIHNISKMKVIGNIYEAI